MKCGLKGNFYPCFISEDVYDYAFPLSHSYQGESRFWLTFENGVLQEWCYSSDHPCDVGGAHRGWLLLSQIQFLRGNGRVQAAGVVRNFLVWLQVDDSQTRLADELPINC